MLAAARARRQPILIWLESSHLVSEPSDPSLLRVRKIPSPTVESRATAWSYTESPISTARSVLAAVQLAHHLLPLPPPSPIPLRQQVFHPADPFSYHPNHFATTASDRFPTSNRSTTTSIPVTPLAGAQTQTTNPHLPNGDRRGKARRARCADEVHAPTHGDLQSLTS